MKKFNIKKGNGMSNKTVNDFVKDLVESHREMPIFPTSWDKELEQYCGEEDQDRAESEEE